MEIYYKKCVCCLSATPSYILLTNLCNFLCVSVCSMWPPFLRVTSWSRRHMFIITRRHLSSSILCTTQQAFLLSQVHWGTASPSSTPMKSQKDSDQGWELAKSCHIFDDPFSGMTWRKGQKRCSGRSCTTLAVCCVEPSCINYCACKLLQKVVLEHMQMSFRKCWTD